MNKLSHELYASIPNFWPRLDEREYALADCFEMEEEAISEIRTATERIGRVFFKAAQIVRSTPRPDVYAFLSQMGYPEETFHFLLSKTIEAESVIARADWALTTSGPKLLELNADTPTFIKELFRVNGAVCEQLGKKDPNKGLEKGLGAAVFGAVREAAEAMGLSRPPKVVFTSHGDHIEDRCTTEYLMEISGIENARFAPLENLWVDENGLFDERGEAIDVLYRQTYPVEHLANDWDPFTGTPIGKLLMRHVREGKVGFVNPPSAFLLQSKALQALIWGIAEEEAELFSEEEREWVKAYFLPTYLEAAPLEAAGTRYVKKPALGREGNTVQIFEADGSLMAEDAHKNYAESVPVYQKFAEMPEASVKTENGEERATLLAGCFLVSGKASAVGLRAGGIITGNTSYFLPLAAKRKPKGE